MKAVTNFCAYLPIDCHKIQKAVFDWDVGDVAAPNMIGPRDWQLS